MVYVADDKRYDNMRYNRCGNSGLKLPAISLGLWQNFGGIDNYENGREMITRAFDLGITHFDLANNYGPPAGSAEELFGKVLANDMFPYRDEIVISTKAGYNMWPGPYGEWGSRKYMLASLDQSLKRLGLDYVDIYYSHRPDPETPLEETMQALDYAVRSGKALYIGLSNYNAEQTAEALSILKSLGTPLLIHQPSYSMLDRWIEGGLQDVLEQSGVGSIAFTPLAEGLLTNKYLNGIPEGSRAAKPSAALNESRITPEVQRRIRALNQLAVSRGQSLAQFALAWTLRGGKVTSALIGASRVDQIEENIAALAKPDFSPEELERIETILKTEL
ncbi:MULTISPECIES: L-glyceraldehyde 3-phosphate reductase [Paenibacillus]|uniref:L-glyceraldehyde 3-phosphate reductase n=1 Tax=Paenibacillus odorifer TaxID=189426 RepID=A0A1R0X542_9BACL|nr:MULTISPECIES: L-glyceraldehyde 3-phosphate reductase [Paenibacillus]AIQ73230.1 L-glyceraldehyde 3-phosphate reductase [Paenibacillus odorifer]ETT61359.1 oxidoreductase aryl-alcohol dehydrogenase [Paenibacillus sp. FSL H8-237]MEC0130257.1 L-glyceraldehyde 3-phosphate reductase [Paenibacillus odorifer]MEC0222168.1 L-glyceraldehyde 3-phosphate reductase [Paenibacillus odorifer]OMC95814.1 L-glyceraldehyde 3-phosphate reductase [Paenibacillus odorifer]